MLQWGLLVFRLFLYYQAFTIPEYDVFQLWYGLACLCCTYKLCRLFWRPLAEIGFNENRQPLACKLAHDIVKIPRFYTRRDITFILILDKAKTRSVVGLIQVSLKSQESCRIRRKLLGYFPIDLSSFPIVYMAEHTWLFEHRLTQFVIVYKMEITYLSVSDSNHNYCR